MKIATVNYARPSAGATARKTLRAIALALVFASLALSFATGEILAGEWVRALEQDHEPAHATRLEGVSAWMRERFSKSEIEALSAEDFRIESHSCSCTDKPDPHFPYRIVLFTTPKGDLLARPEANEQSAAVTLLAVRNGDQYCQLESEEQCYGTFASVCEFTDFRYGAILKPYFPTCK